MSEAFAVEETVDEILAPIWRRTHSKSLLRALGHFRYLLVAGEHSPRGLALVAELLAELPNHYALWDYRAECLQRDVAAPRAELDFCDAALRADAKGFQAWNYRRAIYGRFDALDAERETAFLAELLALDARNYQLWSFRAWLAERFALWSEELPRVDALLAADERNNSVWAFRRVVAARLGLSPESEESLCWRSIRRDAANESAWNYLSAIGGERLSERSLRKIDSLLAERGDLVFALRALVRDKLARPISERANWKELIERLKNAAPKQNAIWSLFEEKFNENICF